jgi:hypothetical protein
MNFFMEPDGALRHLTIRPVFLGYPCFIEPVGLEMDAARPGTT